MYTRDVTRSIDVLIIADVANCSPLAHTSRGVYMYIIYHSDRLQTGAIRELDTVLSDGVADRDDTDQLHFYIRFSPKRIAIKINAERGGGGQKLSV